MVIVKMLRFYKITNKPCKTAWGRKVYSVYSYTGQNRLKHTEMARMDCNWSNIEQNRMGFSILVWLMP